ncbi:MAG TPA: ABC transporter substrate-binding protein, partial [Chloroflexota bacterium]|nr:ABC transporter substrate-binding protein [Chloroflexota bacterium]
MINTVSRRAVCGSIGAFPFIAACGSEALSQRTVPASTSPAQSSALEKEMVLYSARKEELFAPTIKLFEQKSGVKVIVKSGATGELALLVEQERASPRGDVYFTTDAGDADSLRVKSLMDPYKSVQAEKIPAEFKAADGSWTGIIGRSRNIMVNTNLVKPDELPKSVFDLTSSKWKDKVALASIREGGVRLWLASLIAVKGEEFTTKYLTDMLANGAKVLANHTEVTNSVLRGELPLGLTNHYYFVPKKREGAPLDLIYPDQGASEMGTLVTPLVAGIVKGAR